jgi:hypothetical protein
VLDEVGDDRVVNLTQAMNRILLQKGIEELEEAPFSL